MRSENLGIFISFGIFLDFYILNHYINNETYHEISNLSIKENGY